MSLSLGLGLGLGMNNQTGKPSVLNLLAQAIKQKKNVTLKHEGEALSLSPLAIAGEPSKLWLYAYLLEDVPGNAQPGVTFWKLSAISEVKLGADHFDVHPATLDNLGELANIKHIVQLGEDTQAGA